MPILVALKLAFVAWMLVDAIKRQAAPYWYFVILIPFGSFIYFLVVKIQDYEVQLAKLNRLFQRKRTLDEYEYQAEISPSVNNKMALGQALYEASEYARAVGVFEELVRGNSDNKKVLYLLALCYLRTENKAQAISLLKRVIKLDFAFDDYEACYLLARLYFETGQQSESLELLSAVCRKNSSLRPRTVYASYLLSCSRADEAGPLLNEGLRDYKNAPSFVRKRDRKWAKRAEGLLRTI